MSNALLNTFPQEGSNDTLISTSENRITKAAALQEVVENLFALWVRAAPLASAELYDSDQLSFGTCVTVL